MDFGPIIGWLSGIGLILFGIMGKSVSPANLANFWDVSSIAITIGGTFAATFVSYPMGYFAKFPKHMRIITQRNKYKPQVYIEKIVDYAKEARKKGLLTLEDKANEESDIFLKNCILLIVDAIEPAKAKEMLENELICLEDRHSKEWGFYEKMATFAPAFGMIGTLIGLINMLKGLDASAADAASKLGEGMSTALITTFYGSILANFILMPIANKLKARHEEEMVCKSMIVEGVLAIHAGTNPRHIEERLNAFINSSKRGQGSGIEDDSSSGRKSKRRKDA